MVVVETVLAIYVGVCLLYWLWTAWAMVRLWRDVPRLGDLDPPEPQRWPKLSVIVPARNEADKLEPAARTLLASDYPDLEIVLIDDRSTDTTGEIIDRLADDDARVRAVHVTELPDGWLGKVHAMHAALRHAGGEFVLFTDADVHFSPGALRKSVAYCQRRGLDHLAALPGLFPSSLLLDAMISVFLRQFIAFISRPWAVGKPGSRAYTGVGAFNLVRRSAFDATEGFEWLRMEVADDMGLALLLKRSGARAAVVSAVGDIALHWYRTVREGARGAEKSYATLAQFSVLRTLAIALVSLSVEVSPIAALVPLALAPTRWIGYGGIAVFAALVFSAVALARWAQARAVPLLLGPLVAPLMMALFVAVALAGRRRGGVLWRGTLYPAKAFRNQMRVRLP